MEVRDDTDSRRPLSSLSGVLLGLTQRISWTRLEGGVIRLSGRRPVEVLLNSCSHQIGTVPLL